MPNRPTRIALIVGLAAVLLTHAGAGEEVPFPPAEPDNWALPNADLYGIAAIGSRVWAVGYWGTVQVSEDRGATWSYARTPTHETLFDVSFADERNGWAVGANGVVLSSTDGGATWTAADVRLGDEFGDSYPLDTHMFGVAAVSPTEAWAVGDLGIVLHTTNGRSWTQVRIPEEAFFDDDIPDRILNAVAFADSQNGWIVGEFATTLRTTDGGATWTGERTLIDTPADLYLFDLSVSDSQHLATVGLAGSVLISDDGGRTWAPRRTDTSAGLFGVSWGNQLIVAVGDRGEIFVAGPEAEAWKSAKRPRLFNWLSDVVRANGTHMYAVGEKGLILSSHDDGASWKQVSGTQPQKLGAVSIPDSGPSGLQVGRDVPSAPAARKTQE